MYNPDPVVHSDVWAPQPLTDLEPLALYYDEKSLPLTPENFILWMTHEKSDTLRLLQETPFKVLSSEN
jgi:hypothetical protein